MNAAPSRTGTPWLLVMLLALAVIGIAVTLRPRSVPIAPDGRAPAPPAAGATPPPARPAIPIDVGGPIDVPAWSSGQPPQPERTVPPAEVPAAPPAAPVLPPAARDEPLHTIVLADGRGFIGVHDPATQSITAVASIRGGVMVRMPPISIQATAQDIVSTVPYDGKLGPIAAEPDAGRAADVARQREAAAMRAEQRRQEAAERERVRQLALRRAEAERSVAAATESLAAAKRRITDLDAHAAILDDDRRLKLELANGLQLQLNTAQDRWNTEVQTLGPRVRKPDGTWTGGPTPATETLVISLQEQIARARKAAATAEQRKAAESEERGKLAASIPQLEAAIVAAVAERDALREAAPAP